MPWNFNVCQWMRWGIIRWMGWGRGGVMRRLLPHTHTDTEPHTSTHQHRYPSIYPYLEAVPAFPTLHSTLGAVRCRWKGSALCRKHHGEGERKVRGE